MPRTVHRSATYLSAIRQGPMSFSSELPLPSSGLFSLRTISSALLLFLFIILLFSLCWFSRKGACDDLPTMACVKSVLHIIFFPHTLFDDTYYFWWYRGYQLLSLDLRTGAVVPWWHFNCNNAIVGFKIRVYLPRQKCVGFPLNSHQLWSLSLVSTT